MRNIFIFIRRYFTFFFFLLLQGFCFFLLFNYNRYHNVVFMHGANEITGKVYTQYNNIEYYFQLKKTNDSLVKANEKLYNKLKQDFELPDTASISYIDTIRVDSLEKYRKYRYMQAKVIANSVNLPNNYIQLGRGAAQGVSKDLGVIDVNNNVVGTVIDVSSNYAIVMSLLHMQSSISARLKKTGEEGSIVWDGVKANTVLLRGISKGVKITAGDSVVTSGYTERFPYGLLIGTVQAIFLDKKSNSYTVSIKTATNFYNVQYVYVVDNLLKEEPMQLLKQVKRTNE